MSCIAQTHHILSDMVDTSYVHCDGVPHGAEVLKTLLLRRILQLLAVLLGQVLFRELYDKLNIAILLPRGANSWDLVVV